jgi:acetyl esterase/lipase
MRSYQPRTRVLRPLIRSAAPLFVGSRLPIASQRRRGELAGLLLGGKRGTRVETVSLGGVRAERVTPPGAAPGRALLFLHGGGYCVGSPRTHHRLVAALAGQARTVAYVPDYRLAPEHPHPAALEDALASCRALAAQIAPGRIAVAGDSAGGGLALALAMALRDAGDPAPAAIGLICPWLDLGPDASGTRPPAPGEPLLSRATLTAWARAYVGSGDVLDPMISPLRGDLTGLPPLLVDWAGDDLLAPDAQRLDALAREAGAAIESRCLDGLWHDAHMLAGLLPTARSAVAGLGMSLRMRLEHPAPAAGQG